MAYYIHKEPNKYDSMFTPLWYRVGSDNSIQPNFRFVLDIYVQAVLITRLRLIPDNFGRAQVDIGRIIRSFAEAILEPNNIYAPIATTVGAFVAYDVQFGEEYGPSGSVTTYTNIVSQTYEVSNAYVADDPYGKPFAPLYGMTYNWLSSRDTSAIWTARKHPGYISFFNDPVEQGYFTIRELDAYGSPFGGFIQSLQIPFPDRVMVLDLSYVSIVSCPFWNTAPSPAIPVNAEGYVLQMLHADYTPAGDPLYVRFLPEARNDATGLHFLNRFGGYDTFYFSGPARRELDVDRQTMERIPFTFGVGGPNAIGPYDMRGIYAESTINYLTTQTWSRKLSSGFLNDKDARWLSELIASSQIYLDAGGWFRPVVIKDTKWTERLNRFDKMYNLEITIQQTNKVISQSR